MCWYVNADDWENTLNNPYGFYELENMLGMMKRHPFMCYCGYCGEYKEYYDRSFVVQFIKYESKEYLKKIRKAFSMAIYLPYTKAKIFFAKRAKCVKSIELYDFEKENPGWVTSSSYQVKVVFNKDSNDEMEIAWKNRWFRKKEYGKFSYFDYVIEVESFRRDGLKQSYDYVEK